MYVLPFIWWKIICPNLAPSHTLSPCILDTVSIPPTIPLYPESITPDCRIAPDRYSELRENSCPVTFCGILMSSLNSTRYAPGLRCIEDSWDSLSGSWLVAAIWRRLLSKSMQPAVSNLHILLRVTLMPQGWAWMIADWRFVNNCCVTASLPGRIICICQLCFNTVMVIIGSYYYEMPRYRYCLKLRNNSSLSLNGLFDETNILSITNITKNNRTRSTFTFSSLIPSIVLLSGSHR